MQILIELCCKEAHQEGLLGYMIGLFTVGGAASSFCATAAERTSSSATQRMIMLLVKFPGIELNELGRYFVKSLAHGVMQVDWNAEFGPFRTFLQQLGEVYAC